MYSSHPEESTRTGSETVGVVTVVVLPFHLLRCAAEFSDIARRVKTNGSIQSVDVELLAGLEPEAFADLLRDYDLEFG
jgi:hypothetical protein